MGVYKQKALEVIADVLEKHLKPEYYPDNENKITWLSLKNLDQESLHLSEPLQQLLCKIDRLFPVNSHSFLKSPLHTASKVMELLETFFKSNTDVELPKKLKNLIELRAELPKSRSEIMLLPPEKIRQLSQNLCVIFDENFDENQQLSPDIFLKKLTNFLNSKKSIAMFVPTPQKESESKILQTLEESLLNLQAEKTIDERARALIAMSHYQIFDNKQIKERAPNICQIMKLARKKAGKEDGIATIERKLEEIYEKQYEIKEELQNFSMVIYSSSFSDGVRHDGEGHRLFYWEQPKGNYLRRTESEPAVGNVGYYR